MAALSAIVKRIDHIMIRVDDPAPLFGLLRDSLGLPVSWPIEDHGWYASGGVCAGNAHLEIARIGRARPHATASARLFAIGLEPVPLYLCLRELAARGIPHSFPVPFWGERPDGTQGVRWWNVVVGGLMGEHGTLLDSRWWVQGSISSRVLTPMARAMALARWARAASSRGNRTLVYICEYARPTREAMERARLGLDMCAGGALGITGLDEVILGVTNYERARQRWQNLLAPQLSSDRGVWRLGAGPSIRLVPHDEDAMLALVLRTRDLGHAEAWLRERRMLATTAGGHVAIDPVAVRGLDIRLI